MVYEEDDDDEEEVLFFTIQVHILEGISPLSTSGQ